MCIDSDDVPKMYAKPTNKNLKLLPPAMLYNRRRVNLNSALKKLIWICHFTRHAGMSAWVFEENVTNVQRGCLMI